MSRAKVVNLINDRYGGSLDQKTCDMLEYLIDLDSENGYMEDLLHVIFKMDDDDVEDIITRQENLGFNTNKYIKPTGTLRDEQSMGVAFMYCAKDCILGDSVGMGKTVEVAGLANLLRTEAGKLGKKFRYLMLTEKNLAHQVRKELVKFTGEFVQLCPSGEQAVVEKFVNYNPTHSDLEFSVVGTHALLTNAPFVSWLAQLKQSENGFPFDLIIVDESSPLGGKSTNNIVKGYKAIEGYFDRHIFLNATPFETKVEIFYNQLNLLDKKMLPTKAEFTKQYCVMDYTGMYPKMSGKYKNQSTFKQLIGYRYIARTRRDKGAIMEGCKGGILSSELSSIQKEWLKKSQMNRMIYDCPTALDPSIPFNEEVVPKLGSLRELFKNSITPDDSVLIFVHYKEAQAQLSKWFTELGYTNRVLNGSTPTADRGIIVDGFKAKSYNVLITNVQKGLNFGGCNYCIFYSFDPNPSKMIQFEGRTTRQFDIIGKNVYILCSLGKEMNALNKIVKQRATSTSEMTNTDISVVMSILLGNNEEGEDE